MTFCRLILCCLSLLLLAHCAAPPVKKTEEKKSYVVLLPKDGKPSGEVVVTTPGGEQVLNRSYQGVEITTRDKAPAAPRQLDAESVDASFGAVLSALPQPPERFVLYFKLNSTELTPPSRRLLPQIVKSIEKHNPAALSLVGHTDAAGTEGYNHKLGKLRAEAVLAVLKGLGAAPASWETVSRGKSEPAAKNHRAGWQPANRRVEVAVR